MNSMNKNRNPRSTLLKLAGTGTLLLLTACAQTSQPAAPIVSGGAQSPAYGAAPATPQMQGGAEAIALPVGASAQALGAKTHIVQPGENLYRISLNNGLKHQDVARWNGMETFDIKVGQVLRLTPPGGAASVAGSAPAAAPVVRASPSPAPAAVADGTLKPYPQALKLPYSAQAGSELARLSEGGAGAAPAAKTPAPIVAAAPVVAASPAAKPAATAPAAAPVKQAEAPASKAATDSTPQPVAAGTGRWLWPTEGKVVGRFNDKNKGIDIAGKAGQPVLASADGKVVYSGNGLKGYGKLIIVKHDKEFLTAYAHNSDLLVKEGQSVKQGQKIALMGNTDADQVKLHFEIREFGKPVNPENHLGSQP